MSASQVHHHEHLPPGHLKRTVGFYGLMFVSLGSIIGSGWLLGALNAAEAAGAQERSSRKPLCPPSSHGTSGRMVREAVIQS